MPVFDITDISRVIQLAVAPVFLLSGIGSILGVLVNRLSRVTDRFRALERLPEDLPKAALASAQFEMQRLTRRARLVHWAIGACTSSALLICVVVGLMFIDSVSNIETPALIAALFIAAMFALILGLLFFLREIALAQGNVHPQLR
jgi:Ni/Fe-hydrogenase subunit HybB-like protein